MKKEKYRLLWDLTTVAFLTDPAKRPFDIIKFDRRKIYHTSLKKKFERGYSLVSGSAREEYLDGIYEECRAYKGLLENLNEEDIHSLHRAENAIWHREAVKPFEKELKAESFRYVKKCREKYFEAANEQEIRDLELLLKLSKMMDFEDENAADKLYNYLNEVRKLDFSTWVGKEFLTRLREHSVRGKKERKKQRIMHVMFAVFFVLFAMALSSAAVDYYHRTLSRAKLESVQDWKKAQSKKEGATAGEPADVGDEKPKEILPEYQKIHENNPNVAGWLSAPGLELEAPVMQEEEDTGFYLDHSYDGQENRAGSLFTDPKTDMYSLPKCVVVYGHNMKNGEMLGNLDRYKDPEYRNRYSVFAMDTLYEKNRYQIAAVVQTHLLKDDEEGFRYYQDHTYDTAEEMEELFAMIRADQLYETGVKYTAEDSFVILSTCSYHTEEGRLLLVGKRLVE